MGWLYMQHMDGFKTPREYLDNQLTYANGYRKSRVVKSALVHMHTYYAAVESITPNLTANDRQVFAVVCLVRYNPRDKEGYIFGYKDMDEYAGPCERECPKSILDLLTPVEGDGDSARWAREWRADCAKQASKRLPKHGEIVKLATPMTFTNGQVLSEFKAVRDFRTLRFMAGGLRYIIRGFRKLDYTIVEVA